MIPPRNLGNNPPTRSPAQPAAPQPPAAPPIPIVIGDYYSASFRDGTHADRAKLVGTLHEKDGPKACLEFYPANPALPARQEIIPLDELKAPKW